MANKISKERSNNFGLIELNKLKDLLEKYSIILSKKTDHASSKQKDEAWSQLTEEFNSDNLTYRTKKQLIYKFNNMKKTARKELSHEKRERRATGGGPPPHKPSDTSEWICGIMGESIVGLPPTHDSDFINDNSENVEEILQNAAVPNVEEEMSILDIPFHIEEPHTNISIKDVADHVSIIDVQEKEEKLKFDTSTPKSMLKKPVSKPLEPENRKRKLIFTPMETRKKIVTLANEKELYVKKKSIREQKLIEFAEEEHQQNMQHKEEMHKIEIEFKNKINELLLKKTFLEIEIQEEKLKKIKFENKDLLD